MRQPQRSEASFQIDRLFEDYRKAAGACLEPLVRAYYPELYRDRRDECRKMMELSAKMTVVGHACSEICGYPYDARRQRIGSLFGGCCFLADSFLDDFGNDAARDYLERFELLLTTGWFEIRTPREKLFYVIISRLFAERDVLDRFLRQAILLLLNAQKRDVQVRLDRSSFDDLPRHQQLHVLRENARNRSGHAILVLTGFLVPELPLRYASLIFLAGSLIMYIDDHGDYYSDLFYNRLTYINQVADPERTLRRLFYVYMKRLSDGLPEGNGRDVMIGFMTKYYLTRLRKHRLQKPQQELPWAVYE
ncbi:MAG: hypothetical protein AB7G48_10910 [Nitrospiraceae bacterium]